MTPTQDPRTMVYRGGKVLGRSKMQLIFWGKPWLTQKDVITPPGGPEHTVPSMNTWINTIQQILASNYLDGLRQYGINKPVMLKSAINSTYTTGKSCNFKWHNNTMTYNPAICGPAGCHSRRPER